MSWDIFVQDLPKGATRLGDIPDDFQPAPIGSPSELVHRISVIFPEADFSDPTWGVIEGSDFSLEVSLGDGDPITSFALHVRGGESAPFAVARLLTGLGLSGLDPQSDSGLFALDHASLEGFERWRRFRERVVGGQRT